MVRADLENVPEFALPAGFALRWYKPGDEAHWLRIQFAADQYNEITPGLFRKQFGMEVAGGLQSSSARERESEINSGLESLCERQCYLLDPLGKTVGTGTAWFNDNFEGARWGRLHWVAITPEFQGRGLGNALITVTCRRLRDLGHERAYLSTSTVRIPAIKLYLRFGFQPLIRDEREREVWDRVLSRCDG